MQGTMRRIVGHPLFLIACQAPTKSFTSEDHNRCRDNEKGAPCKPGKKWYGNPCKHRGTRRKTENTAALNLESATTPAGAIATRLFMLFNYGIEKDTASGCCRNNKTCCRHLFLMGRSLGTTMPHIGSLPFLRLP